MVHLTVEELEEVVDRIGPPPASMLLLEVFRSGNCAVVVKNCARVGPLEPRAAAALIRRIASDVRRASR